MIYPERKIVNFFDQENKTGPIGEGLLKPSARLDKPFCPLATVFQSIFRECPPLGILIPHTSRGMKVARELGSTRIDDSFHRF